MLQICTCFSVSFYQNQKEESGFQQVVCGLITKNISVFVNSETRSTSKVCPIQYI